jgi:hypothetical protein
MAGEAVRTINGVRVENYARFDFLLDWFEVEYYFLAVLCRMHISLADIWRDKYI